MRSIRNFVVSLARSDWFWTLTLAVAFAGLTLASQNRTVGWEPGYNELQPGHHGWVSSHTMAIISHATPENGFVGYALATLDDDGEPSYEYFDRYPVFFSSAMHALISLKARLTTQMYIAKQAMNGIFLLTGAAAFLVLRLFGLRPLPSLAAILLAVSSPYLIFYKDMVHYDQPALLGMLILVLAIGEVKRGKRRGVVFLATLVAVGLGRGYASLAVLFIWLVVDAIDTLGRKASWRERLTSLVSLPALQASLLGVGWAVVNLAYNVSVAATKTGTPLLETDIIGSAVNRLALSQEFNESYASILGWARFATDEVVRVVRWSFPVWNYEGSWQISTLIVLGMAAILLAWGRTLDRTRRQLLAILTLSGPLWITAMRNLTAFHDYTAMYFLGIPLAFYAGLTHFLRLPRAGWIVAAVLSLGVFAARNDQIQDLHRAIGTPLRSYTYDAMAIADVLPPLEQTVHVADGIPYAPFAFGFFLPDHRLAPAATAGYVISSDPDYLPVNLTPGNAHLFLFENR